MVVKDVGLAVQVLVLDALKIVQTVACLVVPIVVLNMMVALIMYVQGVLAND